MSIDSYAGFDADPSARVAWMLNDHHTIWAAASRASRTPSRLDTAALIAIAAFPGDDGTTQEVVLYGNPRQKAELVPANELGYRALATKRVSVDVAAFFNYYDNLRTREAGTPFVDSSGITVLPLTWGNAMHGTTRGVEISSEWRITNRWKVSPWYTLLQMHLHPDAGGLDMVSRPQAENPRHQTQVRSTMDLRRNLSCDMGLYYVDKLPAQGIPAYERLDTQLRWRIREGVELSLVGQNLLHDRHAESNDIFTIVNPSLMKRSVFARMTWRF